MAFPTVFMAVMHCFLPWLKWYVTNLVTRIIILLLVIIDAMALTTIIIIQLCWTIGDEDLYKEILHFFKDRMAPAVLDLHKGSSSIVATWLIDLCTELINWRPTRYVTIHPICVCSGSHLIWVCSGSRYLNELYQFFRSYVGCVQWWKRLLHPVLPSICQWLESSSPEWENRHWKMKWRRWGELSTNQFCFFPTQVKKLRSLDWMGRWRKQPF